MTNKISIAAAVIRDAEGRVLLVRKRGTTAFMQPGGKIEPGEDPLFALARELKEELGCGLRFPSARYLGEFAAPAANEAGQVVVAKLYNVAVDGTVTPAAEIDEVAWVDPRAPGDCILAPLTRDAVLPLMTGDNGSAHLT